MAGSPLSVNFRMTPYEQHLIEMICPAIQLKKLVRIWDKNATSALQDWRTAEPYLIGSFPNRNTQLVAWVLPTAEQILAGQREGWRAYLLKNISEVQVLELNIEKVREDYDPLGNGMKVVLCAARRDPFMRIV